MLNKRVGYGNVFKTHIVQAIRFRPKNQMSQRKRNTRKAMVGI